MKKLNKNQKRYLELSLLIGILIIAFFLWNTFLVYPLKIFVVIIHEFSHAVMAAITGGKVHSVEVYWNLAGETRSSEGIPILIILAGYTGSIIYGSLLFYSAYNKKFRTWFLPLTSGILIILMANFMSEPAGIVFTFLFVVLLIVIPNFTPNIISAYFLKIIGLLSVLYSVYDIKSDLLSNSVQLTDAHLLANFTGISPFLWGLLWFVLSITILIILLRFGYKKGYGNKY